MAEDNKDIEALIENLSETLKPARSLLHPFTCISPWVVVAFAYMAGVIHFLGIRMDWMDRMAEAPFVFELLLTAAISVSAAYAAGWMAIPDMREQNWLMAVPATLFGAFLAFMGCLLITKGVNWDHIGASHCFSDALLMSFVPIATLTLLLKKGATTRPVRMTFMSVLSVGALGWAAMRLTCPGDDPAHTLVFHFLPFVLAAVLLGALARRLYKW